MYKILTPVTLTINIKKKTKMCSFYRATFHKSFWTGSLHIFPILVLDLFLLFIFNLLKSN